jgi:hypothetical protein
MLRVLLLLSKALREGCDSANNADRHEAQADDRPNDTPALRGSSVLLSKNAGVRAVYFAQDEIVALEGVYVSFLDQWLGSGVGFIQYPRHYKGRT